MGASQASNRWMRTAGSPPNRCRIEVGSALRDNEGTSRADSSTNGALVVNRTARHQQANAPQRARRNAGYALRRRGSRGGGAATLATPITTAPT